MQPSYVKSAIEWKQKNTSSPPPSTMKLFIADAVSMYTNIDTNVGLRRIGQLIGLLDHEFNLSLPVSAIIDALIIVMRNNVFRFGDTYCLQVNGTAMGTPPAPAWATLYYAIHEKWILAKYRKHLWNFGLYIDDIQSGWIAAPSFTQDELIWKEFKEDLCSFHNLDWIVSE